MTPLWITSCTNLINDRAAALEFGSAFSTLLRRLKPLETETTPKGFLAKIYVIFDFDSGEAQVSDKPRYNARRKYAECEIMVAKDSMRGLNESARTRFLHSELIQVICGVRQYVESKGLKHELDELIATLRAQNPEISRAEALSEELVAPVSNGSRIGTPNPANDLPSKSRYQLVLQLPEDYFQRASGNAEALEEQLAEVLADEGDVDGNDVGGGRYNIYVLTGDPHAAFRLVRATLQEFRLLSEARVAYRELKDDTFVSMWPMGKNERFEL